MHYRYSIIQRALVCLLMFCTISTEAQTSFKKKIEAAPVKSYTVGDKVPDLVFKNLINSSAKQTKLSEYKGKLVIIDFWEWGCIPCMQALGKIQKLQKEFTGQVEVITVTSRITPEYFKEKSKETPSLKNFSLPTVMRDVQLFKYFPFNSISHLVWIDGNGIVKAITGSDYVTAENIRIALKDEPVPWAIKKDVIDFDNKKPLMVFGNSEVNVPPVLYSSVFTGYLEGVTGGVTESTDSARDTKTINFINQSVTSFCDGSLDGQGTGYISPKYMVLDVTDSSRFIWNHHKDYFDQWLKKNVHSYSVTIPANLSVDEQKEFIKTDLTHWLKISGITVKKEFREIPCYALVTTSNKRNHIGSKGGEPVTKMNFPDDESFIRNDSLSNFIYYLNKNNESLPYLFKDSTGLPSGFQVDMKFSENVFSSIHQLRKELQLYGFDLVPSSCRTEMHIITEKKLTR